MSTENDRDYEVIIEGAGVTGVAVALILTWFTNVSRIAIFERRPGPAQVNSASEANSQTLHAGRAESNYTTEQALAVSKKAALVLGFIRRFAADVGIPMPTLMLGVGAFEVREMREKFAARSPHFPDLQLLERDEIALIEPKLMEGRDPNQEVVALYSEDGYAVNFEKLGVAMLNKAREIASETGKTLDVFFDTEVTDEVRTANGFSLRANGALYTCRTLEVAKGNASILVAHRLGYAKNLVAVEVGGDYYIIPNMLHCKVYGYQNPRIPNAQLHLDTDINDPRWMRLGPTVKLLFLLERGLWRTFLEFLEIGTVSPAGANAIRKLLWHNPEFTLFILTHIVFRWPLIGKWLLVHFAARKYIPTLRARDLRLVTGMGGIRGQLLDLTTGELDKASQIEPPPGMPANCTPAASPGASGCLGNAVESVRRHVEWLGEGYIFDEEAMRETLLDKPVDSAA